MSIKVTLKHFTGGARLYETDNATSLAAIVRGLAIDNARSKVENSNVADLTDNSTGVASQAGFVNLVLPAAAIDATAAGGVSTTALNTSLGKARNAQKVLATSMNNVLSRLGLPTLATVEGTQASANTIPAQDLTSTGATGNAAAEFGSTLAALQAVKYNHQAMIAAYTGIVTALGDTLPASKLVGAWPQSSAHSLGAIPAVVSVAAGPGAVAKADVDAFLTAFGDNLATLAAHWNLVMNGGSYTALTDSTGGTSGGDVIAAVVGTPLVGHQDNATDSAPAAALNTLIGVYNNAFASLASTVNGLLEENGMSLITDDTGGTVSGTLAVEAASLTPTTGATSVTLASTETALAAFEDNVSTLASAVNALAPLYGVDVMADNSGGVVSASGTLVAVPATVAADNTASAIGVQETALATILGSARNAVATLAAKVNSMVGSSAPTVPLHVVAG